MTRRVNTSALLVRAILRSGDGLIKERGHWRYGRRLFNAHTIKAVIDSGDAVRQGNLIIPVVRK